MIRNRVTVSGRVQGVFFRDTCRRMATARGVAGWVRNLPDGRAVAVDLTDLAAVDRLGLDADILVNNAGIQHVAPVEQFPPEQFSLMLRLMVEAPFRLVRQCLPGMYARGWGRIVNISSVHGVRASEFKVAYVTAKHALEAYPRWSRWRAPRTASRPTA